MNAVEIAAVAFIAGLIGGIAADWRGWLRLAKDLRRHGLDNHFCDEQGCCR